MNLKKQTGSDKIEIVNGVSNLKVVDAIDKMKLLTFVCPDLVITGSKPQGLPISAVLANMYMYDFDKSIYENWIKPKGVFYRRYSDDMIFLCNESDIDILLEYIYVAIDKLQIKVAHDKTEKIYFMESTDAGNSNISSYSKNKKNELIKAPLTYLGFEFYGNKTYVKTKNLSAFYREMKDTVRRKNSRTEFLKSKNLTDDEAIFKRKLYRLYSYHGMKTRKLNTKNSTRNYRGNFLRYVHKSADILEAPEMRRQVRNHWNIMQKTLHKYDFNNIKKQDN